MNRLFGIVVAVMWLTATFGLIRRDIWPALTARQPPPTPSTELIDRIGEQHQYGIFRASSGARVGTSWMQLQSRPDFSNGPAAETAADITSITYLEPVVGNPRLLIELNMHLLADGTLDNFMFDVIGAPFRLHAEGESYGKKLACNFEVGLMKRQFSLDTATSSLVGDSFHPFSCLPALQVGQAWRMQVIDPLSALTGGRQLAPRTKLVRVESKETIRVNGEEVEAFVVETDGARAWVDERGLVLRQQLDVPLIGRLIVHRERYDERTLTKAKSSVSSAPAEPPSSMLEDAS